MKPKQTANQQTATQTQQCVCGWDEGKVSGAKSVKEFEDTDGKSQKEIEIRWDSHLNADIQSCIPASQPDNREETLRLSEYN